MKYTIEHDTAQEIINYLVQQPFKDVASLIDKISRLEPLTESSNNHSEDTVVMPRSKSAS